MLDVTGDTVRSLEFGPFAPVPVFQHRWEFEALLDLYRSRVPRRVLEIGTYHGGTLFHLLRHALPGAVVVTVDAYTPDPVSLLPAVDNRHLYVDWVPAGVELVVVEGDSHADETIVEVAQHRPYDFVFIDGDHSYKGVREDWETYSALCASGALVVFHDIIPGNRAAFPDMDVHTLWREIQARGFVTQELIADQCPSDPDMDWGGIGVVRLPS